MQLQSKLEVESYPANQMLTDVSEMKSIKQQPDINWNGNQSGVNISCVDREQMKKDKTAIIAMKLKLHQAQKSESLRAPIEIEHQKQSDLRLFVGRLSTMADEKSLKDHFGKYGEITDVFIPHDNFGNHRGFAYVSFSHFFGDHPMKTLKHIINGK